MEDAKDSKHILFQDIFDVVKVNPEGKKFERVNRLQCKGETYETDMILDIASEVYALAGGDKFTLLLTSTLRLDGQPDSDDFNQDGKPTLLDSYEYGMCGKVFRYEHMSENKVAVIASFGGLLMQLVGQARDLARIRMDSKVYCLLRRPGGGAGVGAGAGAGSAPRF